MRLILLRKMLIGPEQFGDNYARSRLGAGILPAHTGGAVAGIGRLDENYFMYVEDVDLCKRVWDRGLNAPIFLTSATYIWGV